MVSGESFWMVGRVSAGWRGHIYFTALYCPLCFPLKNGYSIFRELIVESIRSK